MIMLTAVFVWPMESRIDAQTIHVGYCSHTVTLFGHYFAHTLPMAKMPRKTV